MDPIQVATRITTPLALVAFIAALAFYAYRTRLTERRKTLESASQSDRPSLIEGAIRDFTILKTESLSNQQKYHLIRDELNHRMRRFLIASITAVIIALALLSVLVILQKGEWFGPSERKEPAQTSEREQPNPIEGKVQPQPTDTAVNAEPKSAFPRKSTTDKNSIREKPVSNQSNNMGSVEAGSPTLPPKVMHICIAHCIVLTWENGHYVNYAPTITSVYTVESFTRDSVILHRTDRGSFPLTAVLTGKLSSDGNSIVNGRIVWTSGNTGQGAWRAAWGPAINTVPGSGDPR